jgi:hypothetical protein
MGCRSLIGRSLVLSEQALPPEARCWEDPAGSELQAHLEGADQVGRVGCPRAQVLRDRAGILAQEGTIQAAEDRACCQSHQGQGRASGHRGRLDPMRQEGHSSYWEGMAAVGRKDQAARGAEDRSG